MKPRQTPNPVQALVDRGDHPVTPTVLFTGACEYARAAWILGERHFLPMVPFGQLVSQSIELALKAYLTFRGVDEDGLKSIGHDLERAWQECKIQGLEVTLPSGWLASLNMHYGTPFLYRYWRQGLGWGFPGTPKRVLRALHSALTQISAAINDDGVQLAEVTRTPSTPAAWPDH
jgi:hypothetical protein